MPADLTSLIDTLRQAGGDSAAVEVKAAAGGLPESLTATLSALANLPGGGTVILGIDERRGFLPVALPDPQKLKQGLAAKARSYVPPIVMDIDDGIVHGAPVVVARVHECDRSAKPCRVTSSGRSYMRGYDGDFMLSDLEEQAFLASRKQPAFDRRPVPGSSAEDLDPDLVNSFVSSVRGGEPRGRGRFADREELLRRSGVLLADGTLTVAGLLTLGLYPQQWYPRYVIQAAAEPSPGSQPAARARNQATFSGPIPHMLDQAMEWARRTFDSAIVTMADGSVHDQYAYPLIAFRELIANALIHRDLYDWSEGMAVEVRLRRDRLIIGNPGGLYGITVDRLGNDYVTSARNPMLVSICQHVYSAETGARTIEALATGIPIVTRALADACLPPAHYIDTGIRFVVLLRPSPAQAAPTALAAALPPREQAVYDALGAGPQSVADLETRTAMPAYTIRRALRSLREQHLAEILGGKGRLTKYRRNPSAGAS